ncbi:hypothetical protein PF008_g26939 [Phytophthora fragariae]|uniref:RxLR effector protein n=2 Tax=Phytophthora fragariae TaxID=53985 RepID=A0A6A3DQW7_9STRA|nr:hypothetical protein PF003_g2507 [Phytophthora fragariae]KAE8921491.1 hypothetical protein PF009_g28234 [Phytophthora fragariae]KAE9285345.1 hypothetical protein PF008_g26939 [Phytophthora fragariae]
MRLSQVLVVVMASFLAASEAHSTSNHVKLSEVAKPSAPSQRFLRTHHQIVEEEDDSSEERITARQMEKLQAYAEAEVAPNKPGNSAVFVHLKGIVDVTTISDILKLNHFTMNVFSKIGFEVELDTLKNTFDQGGDHEFLEASSVACGMRIQTLMWL